MTLTDQQLDVLFRCVGGGPIDRASLVFFGNELGTAETGNTETSVLKFVHDWTTGPKIRVGEGFVTLGTGAMPVSSVFLRLASRMALAIKHKDDRFLGTLSGEGKAFLNAYIAEELYRTGTACVDLRPLPQSTEECWEYGNVDRKAYQKMFNFRLKKQAGGKWRDLRVSALKAAFEAARGALVLGCGERHNKRAFFETTFPGTKFEDVRLGDGTEMHVSRSPRIVLSNFYSHRNGVKLSGLRSIYQYLSEERLI